MPTGQPSGDRVVWDDANEKHLLLCILAEANPQKLDWSKIAERFGKKLTSGAASQKYGKIKNRDKQIFEGAGGATPSSPSKKPASKSATPSAKRTKGGKPKNATPNGHAAHDDGEEDDEFLGTPSKKVKTEAFALEGFEHHDSGIDNNE